MVEADSTGEQGQGGDRLDELTKTVIIDEDGQAPETRTSVSIRDYMVRHGRGHDRAAEPSVANIATTERYELAELLSRGGMGAIFVATDSNIHRQVAMKVMLAGRKGGPKETEQFVRFVHEAQITGQLEHPNIVPVHEFAVDERNNPFYTMKLIRGVTLENILANLKRGNPDMIAKYPLSKLLRLFLKVCDAVAFAHARGVIHRDLKPENIMVGDFGEVMVMDWGVAKILDGGDLAGSDRFGRDQSTAAGTPVMTTIRTDRSAAHARFKTQTGEIVGTPIFMAPEQAAKDGVVDRRADVYALGGILYQILTLEPPVSCRTLHLIFTVKAQGDIAAPASFSRRSNLPHCPGRRVPDALSAVAMKALAPQPDDRFASVNDLQQDVDAYLSGFATSAESASLFRMLSLMVTRHASNFAIATVAVLLLAGVIGMAGYQVVQAQREAEEALLAAAQLARPGRTQEPFGDDARAPETEKLVARLIGNAARALEQANPAAAPLRLRHWRSPHGWSVDLSGNTELRDLSPLAALPLVGLVLRNTAVKDISPLRTMPLTYLDLSGCPVASVTDLEGMALRQLNLRDTMVGDVGSLLACTQLRRLILPEHADNVEALRAHETLAFLSYDVWDEPAAAFWRRWMASMPAAAGEGAGPSAGQAGRATAGAGDQ